MRLHLSRRGLRWASATIAASAALTVGTVLPAVAAPASAAAPAARVISPGTRFFVPPPSSGAPQQVVALLKSRDL